MPPSSTTSPSTDSFTSPNAIPPRSSSYGVVPQGHHPQKPVLRPLSEVEWLSQGRRGLVHQPSIESTLYKDRRRRTKSNSQMATMQEPAQEPAPKSTPPPKQEPTQPAPAAEQPAVASDDRLPPPEAPKEPRRQSPVDRQSTWTAQKESILLSPYTYLENHPGKDIRSQLIAAFNVWLQVPKESLEVITRVVGMLHTSSLLVDDVEDSSLLRRGIPVAHSIFGTAQTINSANYVYFLALQNLSKLQNPATISMFTEELLNLHRGQGMDLFWRDTLTCPSEADYLEMVGNKTGGLFRLAVKLMMAESSLASSNSVPDCVPLVNTVGALFQILDDYLNLQSTAYAERKGMCEDLTEGKFSFPVIHAIRSDVTGSVDTTAPITASATGVNGYAGAGASNIPASATFPLQLPAYNNNILINILKQKTHDEEVKRYAVRYMEERGSFAYTRTVIGQLHEDAFALMDQVATTVGGENGPLGAAALRKILAKLKAE